MKKFTVILAVAVLAALALSASAALFGNDGSGGVKSYWKTELHADKRNAVKKLALVSVFGPSQGATIATDKDFSYFPQQDNLDYLEESLRSKFAAAGMSAVSGDQAKPAFETIEVTAAVSQAYGQSKPSPEQKAMMKKQMEQVNQFRGMAKAMGKPSLSKNREHLENVPMVASAHTDMIEDHAEFKRNERLTELYSFGFHDKFLKAVGGIAKDLSADGFALARIYTSFAVKDADRKVKLGPQDSRPVAHAELALAVFNNAGELVFSDTVNAEGQDRLGEITGGGTTFKYKEGDVQKLTKAAIDQAVAKAFEDLTAKK